MTALVSFFNPVFELVMVPFLSEHKAEPRKITGFANSFVLLCLPVIVVLAVGLGVILPPLAGNASGLGPGPARLAAVLFLEMLPLIVLWTWSSGFNSVFYTLQVFWFPAISPLLRTAGAIGTMIVAKPWLGIHALILGFTAGEALRWAVGGWFLGRKSWWRLVNRWGETRAKFAEFLGQVGYQILALLAINLVPLADQWFASWFGEGQLSLMSYADRLFKIPHQFFVGGLLPIYLSHWSEAFQRDDRQAFWKRVRSDTRKVTWIALAVSAVMAVLCYPVLGLVFGGARFSAGEVRVLGHLCFWLILGFMPAAVNLLYIRVLFVLRKSWVFCAHAWVRLALNIVLNWVFSRIWGIVGIAVSTTVAYTVTYLWLEIYVRRARADAEAKEARP
jgi:putative peptidoglycan lipid II flippase